jgi:hypothetical protein
LKNRAVVISRASKVANRARTGVTVGKRWRGDSGRQGVGMPPENWYEPNETGTTDYEIIVQSPGKGFVHVLTAEDIRQRLAQLPPALLTRLEVVQLSRMTRKKRTFPCYGLQWGASIYLYPVEESLTEFYPRPPRPAERHEAAMYGAEWTQESRNLWALRWTWPAIRDFYLNNVLIHELGHILDDRNSRAVDRERYAEWFALEFGYKRSRTAMAQAAARRVTRRHGR